MLLISSFLSTYHVFEEKKTCEKYISNISLIDEFANFRLYSPDNLIFYMIPLVIKKYEFNK